MSIDGIVIFDSVSGLPLFSKVDKVDSTLFSGFLAAARKFFSQLSLGGLSSFSTEEKVVFLAVKTRVITAIITSGNLDNVKGYKIAYEISEKFENDYDLPKFSLTPDTDNFIGFTSNLDKILSKEDQFAEPAGKEHESEVSLESRLLVKTIYLYTVNKQGDVISIDSDVTPFLSSYPVLIIVNSIIKRIYILENDEDISNRLLFFASKAATKINNKQWKSEFQVRNVSDPLDCQRLIDQVKTLINECDVHE
ncbi:MAG: hypothetical protein ACXAEU_15960 [Candidatus Hodarchaeales archaeon]|jgi:hypothetical protein